MPLLTRAELERRMSPDDLAQLADLTGSGDESAGMVSSAIADAEAEVLGYVRAQVDPALLSPVPDLLKRITCDVARINLFQRHVRDDHPAMIAYRQALVTLRDIAAGRVVLPLEPAAAGASATGRPAAYAPARVFTDTTLPQP